MTNTKKKQKKKRKNKKTKKISPLKTIYKHHEFGGTYPVIHPFKYAAQRQLDNLNLPSDFPSNQQPLKNLIIQDLIRRIVIYLKYKKNRKILYKLLKIRYNKKNIYSNLQKYSKTKTKLQKLEKLYKTILLSK
tara:strand:+ start:6991 stop:7389 length:399 start_codon:yes stop_codon:yes gene_type:complete